MGLLSLMVMLSTAGCPKPVILNISGDPWNEHDEQTLKGAQKRCGELYSDSPCVKWFKKYEKQSYSVICGEPNKEQKNGIVDNTD